PQCLPKACRDFVSSNDPLQSQEPVASVVRDVNGQQSWNIARFALRSSSGHPGSTLSSSPISQSIECSSLSRWPAHEQLHRRAKRGSEMVPPGNSRTRLVEMAQTVWTACPRDRVSAMAVSQHAGLPSEASSPKKRSNNGSIAGPSAGCPWANWCRSGPQRLKKCGKSATEPEFLTLAGCLTNFQHSPARVVPSGPATDRSSPSSHALPGSRPIPARY